MVAYYNLLYREEEREMLPLCADQGIGSIPWSPLARGQLTRPWAEQTNRSQSDRFSRTAYTDADRPIVEAVADMAATRGVTPAQIALAWVLSKPVIDSPIIGATKPHHLADAVAAVDLRLDESEIDTLEKGYQPHPVIGVHAG
jgi:1-deoxyxylulose-5-phosphate synthase